MNNTNHTRRISKIRAILIRYTRRYLRLSPASAASLSFVFLFLVASENFHRKMVDGRLDRDALIYTSMVHRQLLNDQKLSYSIFSNTNETTSANSTNEGMCKRIEMQFVLRSDLLRIIELDKNNKTFLSCGPFSQHKSEIENKISDFSEKNSRVIRKPGTSIVMGRIENFPESYYFVVYYPHFDSGNYVGTSAFLYHTQNFFSEIISPYINNRACIKIISDFDNYVLAASSNCSISVGRKNTSFPYERITTVKDNEQSINVLVKEQEITYFLREDYVRLSIWLMLFIILSVSLFYRGKSKYIESQKQDILSLSMAALCVFDKDFRFRQVNEIFTSYAGSILQVIGQKLIQFVSEEYKELVADKLSKISSGPVSRVFFEAEFIFKNPSDSEDTYNDTYWLVWEIHRSSCGEYFTAIAQDLTAHKKIAKALQKEKAFGQAIGDSMITGVQVTDMKCTVTYVNPAFSAMTGYSRKECLGTSLPFPYEITQGQFSLEEFINEGCNKSSFGNSLEVRVIRKDGTSFEAHLYVSPLTDQNKKTFGWIVSVIDVTEKNRVRRILESSHQQFTTVVNSLEAAVCVFDHLKPKVLFYNAYYYKNFGSSPDMHLQLSRGIPKAARSGSDQCASGEVYLEQLQRWFEVRVRLIPWVDGNKNVVMSVSTDITKRKTAEQLYQQQQEKVQQTSHLITMGEMASSLSHELNQPLTAISNYSTGSISRLESGTMSLEEVLKVLRKTAFQAERAGRIIRSIRDFVKKNEPRFFLCNMSELLAEAVEFTEVDASKKNISIDLLIDGSLPRISVDPILIQQVLINLIKNASDAMQDSTDRVIRVIATSHDEVLEISVIDKGHGINPDIVDKLFAPFFTTKTEGMGMGLNICRSIIEYHKGRLWAENNPGGGSTFRFTLPCVIE
ncbi:PAS domain S-box protein [Candidatus Ichthyocystis sparus]|nr:PAS domain S-box protein [Candidatus Ichthyocystis sparus]